MIFISAFSHTIGSCRNSILICRFIHGRFLFIYFILFSLTCLAAAVSAPFPSLSLFPCTRPLDKHNSHHLHPHSRSQPFTCRLIPSSHPSPSLISSQLLFLRPLCRGIANSGTIANLIQPLTLHHHPRRFVSAIIARSGIHGPAIVRTCRTHSPHTCSYCPSTTIVVQGSL